MTISKRHWWNDHIEKTLKDWLYRKDTWGMTTAKRRLKNDHNSDSECHDVVHFGGVAFSVESVITDKQTDALQTNRRTPNNVHLQLQPHTSAPFCCESGCQCEGTPSTRVLIPYRASSPDCVSAYGVATISRLHKNYRSLLQNIVSFTGLFCKRDL